MKMLRILHLEDIASDAELVERTLRKSAIEFEKILVDNETGFRRALTEFYPDIILSDHSLPSFNSLAALKVLKENKIDIPFILITSTVSEEFAVNIIKEGASDYILKDRLQRLPNAVINAIEKSQSEKERQIFFNKVVASEALFTKAELIAEFGTWRVNLATNIVEWSAGTYKLLGYTEGEVEPSYESFLRNIHPDDKADVERVFNNAIERAQAAEAECRILNKDNTVRYMRSQFEFELDETGKPTFVIGFNQDITRSKLAQLEIEHNIEELKAASERQSAILNALPPNIVLLNEAGKIVAVNESWRKFTLANNLGVPKYGIDYSYLAISEKATGADEQTVAETAIGIKEVIAGTRDEFSIEYSCVVNKTKVWFQLIAAPLTDKSKKGAVVLHIDITDRKKAEESMFQSKANLSTILENADIAYILCDIEHKIVSFNTKANEFSIEQSGKPLKTGGNGMAFFNKSKIPNVKKDIEKVLNNEVVSYETSYNFGDGTVKWYDVRWVGIAGKKGANIGFMLAFNDITDRKVSDIERDKITADLLKRNKDLEQFTYIVSHNLRAPVANIIGLSNMLNNFELGINEEKEIKDNLLNSINILDQTIIDLNQILEISSQIDAKNEIVSLKLLVEDLNLTLSNLIRTENATIVTDFAAADKIITVKSFMYSIFYTLLTNSIKYRRPDVDPAISVYTRKYGDVLEIVFKDNGKGIDERNFKNLFGLYKKFDTNVDGNGMGLFMTKMQVENLGGKISAESKPGSGTTFKLEFPYSKLIS